MHLINQTGRTTGRDVRYATILAFQTSGTQSDLKRMVGVVSKTVNILLQLCEIALFCFVQKSESQLRPKRTRTHRFSGYGNIRPKSYCRGDAGNVTNSGAVG